MTVALLVAALVGLTVLLVGEKTGHRALARWLRLPVAALGVALIATAGR